MELYYSDTVTADYAILNSQEGHHLIRVMRRGVGEVIHFTDGLGSLYSGEIVEVAKSGVKVRIIDREIKKNGRRYWLHIAMVIPKNRERFEWFLEKAVEIGVDEITPLVSHHSERHQLNMERTEKVLIAAAKQSLKYSFTKLNQVTAFDDFLKVRADRVMGERVSSEELRVIAHCHAGEKSLITSVLREYLTVKGEVVPKSELGSAKRVVALIGPEGDFSLEEVEAALKAGFQHISLGESRLRVETAGLMVVSALYLD